MHRVVGALLCGLALASGAARALEPPVVVSPGHASESRRIGDPCPTFIWGWQSGVRHFELVVYRIEEDGRDSESLPVIRTRVPGSATAWTPSLDSCLEDGSHYAWSLRATAGAAASDWSPPRLFRVTAAPTTAEFERALAVVERYLRQHERQAGTLAGGSTGGAAPARTTVQAGYVSSTTQAAPAPATSSSSAASVSGGGIVVDGATVETKAAPPCYPSAGGTSATSRLVDCANGTVLDTVTGLLWLSEADCLGSLNWWEAHAQTASLASGQCGLADHSQPGDWRLPTREEWQATVGRAVVLGCTAAGSGSPPTLVNNPGAACLAEGPTSFTGAHDAPYWTSSTAEVDPITAYSVDLGDGIVEAAAKSSARRVWAVRGSLGHSWATYR